MRDKKAGFNDNYDLVKVAEKWRRPRGEFCKPVSIKLRTAIRL